jgi:hypothetical protein
MGTKSGPWVIFRFIAATLVLAITFSLLFTALMLAYLLEYFLYIQHDCLMPKLVGNLTQTHADNRFCCCLTATAHRQENYSFLQKIVSFIFCLYPPYPNQIICNVCI